MRKKSGRLIIIVWALYFVVGIISLLWVTNESRQILAKYQGASQCNSENFTAIPQNCRTIIKVRVYDKWITNTPGGGVKSEGHWDKINFNVSLPNGDRRTLSVPINDLELSEQGEFNSFYMSRFLEMEQGSIAQAEYWEDRVTSVTVPFPVLLGNPSAEYTENTFNTIDHPVYYRSQNLSKVLSLLGAFFFAIVFWTAFLLLRK